MLDLYNKKDHAKAIMNVITQHVIKIEILNYNQIFMVRNI